MSSAAPEKDRVPAQPSLLKQVRRRVRSKHLSRRTERAYMHWIKRLRAGNR